MSEPVTVLQMQAPRPPKERAIEAVTKIADRIAAVRHKERGWPEVDVALASAAIQIKLALEKLHELDASIRPIRQRGTRVFTEGAVYKVRETARARILKILSTGGSAPAEDAADFAQFIADLGDGEVMCAFLVEGQEKNSPVRSKDLAEEVIAK